MCQPSCLLIIEKMSSSKVIEPALTKSDLLVVSDQCLATKNGGTMKIYKALHKQWGPVVYKKLEDSVVSEDDRKKLKREIEVQIQLHHPSIEKLIGMVLEEPKCGLVLEYLKYGNIMEFMKDFQVDWGWKLQMGFDIVLGMNYLHTQTPSIVHGDLTSQNILIGEGFKAKISNFGFSHWKQYSKALSRAVIDTELVNHIPPENWKSQKAEKGEPFDVYGFGILLYEVLSERPAYDGETDPNKISEKVIGGKRPRESNIPNGIPDKFKQVVTDCWSGEITKRPTFRDLKNKFEKLCLQYEVFIMNSRKSLNDQDEQKEMKENAVTESHGGSDTDKMEIEIDSKAKKPLKKKYADEMIPEDYNSASGDREPSDDEIEDNLIRNYVTVLKNADVDVIDITEHLWSAGVLKDEQRDKIWKKRDNTCNRAALRMLLEDLLFRKPKGGYIQLSKTFVKINKTYLAQMIRNTKQSPENSPDTCDGVTSDLNRQIKHKVVDNYRDLVGRVDPEDLFDLLFQERIISLEDKKLIQNKSDATSTQQGTRALLDFLFYSDSKKAFVVFLQALEENYYGILEDV